MAYATDLSRRSLQNRKCADDLQCFLQVARRPTTKREEEWEEQVNQLLPWSNVPGFTDPLYIEPNEEDSSGIVFFGIVLAVLLIFANVIGPSLIGQSTCGPTNYIVTPEELQTMI